MTQYPPRKSVQVTAPALEPLTLAEIKLFLRVDGSEEDSLIDHLTVAARELCEQYLRKVLITQSWQQSQVYVPGQAIILTPGPIQTVTKVTVETNGQQTELSASDYELLLPGNKLAIEVSGAAADRVTVDFVAGYGDAEDVPAPIRQGILQAISYLYHHREETTTLSPEAKALWENYREVQL